MDRAIQRRKWQADSFGYSPAGGLRRNVWAVAATLLLQGTLLAAVLTLDVAGGMRLRDRPAPNLTVVELVRPVQQPREVPQARARPTASSVSTPLPAIVEQQPEPVAKLPALHRPTLPSAHEDQPSPVQAPAPDASAAYAMLLWQRINANRPRGNLLQGQAVVSFRLDRNGGLLAITIARSSGVATLDRLALRAVRASAPFPLPPDELNDAQLDFAVPVNFR